MRRRDPGDYAVGPFATCRRAATLSLSLLAILCAGCVIVQPTDELLVSQGLVNHPGLGYTLSVPAGAEVTQLPIDASMPLSARARMEGVQEWKEIRGPEVEMLRSDTGTPHAAPAYALDVIVYDNPERLDAETWARTRILDEWRRASETGAPLGGLPVQDGAIREDRVERTTVAGEPAFLARYWGGASDYITCYLANDARVVALRYELISVRNEPLGLAQEHAALLLMSTLRLR